MKAIAITTAVLALVMTASAQTSAPTAKPPGLTEKLASRHETAVINHMRVYIFRLRPGDDLLESIQAFARAHHIQAAVVLSGVGSLTQASIRFANQPDTAVSAGHFEIVSLTGTVEQGGEHLHLSVSTEKGETLGGHLMPGCKIYTTAEIALGELQGVRFARETDREGSGWDELKIYPAVPVKPH
ncbi:MAG: PPC domain-containing DNA-binding protein [Candidatus Acidiferrales bacterium]